MLSMSPSFSPDSGAIVPPERAGRALTPTRGAKCSATLRVSNRTAPGHAPRRGAVLLAVIVLLAILMALSATWIRRAVHERQQLDRREIEIQATRLAESGLARARARLARDANYTGELWEIAPDAWHAGRAARVQIDAKPIDRDVQQIQITAKAVYPYEDARAVQRTRTLLVERPTVQPSKQ